MPLGSAGSVKEEERRKTVEEALREYNRYRSPESTAKLIRLRGGTLEVEFSGRFVDTCGVADWVEDLVFELERKGVKAKLKRILETGDYERVGVFEIIGWGEEKAA